jgi:putative hydrolase of the HAD superfamily
MIQTLIFDLGGVVITLDQSQAVRRFEALGLKDASEQLNAYTQDGIFGDLEGGKIDAETFRRELSLLTGRDVTHQECAHAWQGYAKDVPQRNLDALKRLRKEGYRLLLLSNTNPYMMEWVDSTAFDGQGHSIRHYFDAIYLSYEMKLMKPDGTFFRRVLMAEQVPPSSCLFLDDGPRNVASASQIGINTLCPKNGEDWTKELFAMLGIE